MTYSSQSSIIIDAPKEKVWEALTEPEHVKHYFFDTNLVTDWKVGSPIYFRGEYNGTSYEDKGTVLAFDPMDSFSFNYWSSMSGIEDKPELYQVLVYTLADTPEGVKVTIDQSNVATEESANHSGENWKKVLEGLKEYVAKM
jgi:uncharacterized protein YndB with AHSA1/START domain